MYLHMCLHMSLILTYVTTYVNRYVKRNAKNVRACTRQTWVRQQILAYGTTLKANITQSGGYARRIDDIDD